MPFFYSDDPVRDADRHTAWQDRHYVHMCSHCDQPIDGDYHHVYCVGDVCEDCYDKHYREDEED